MFSSISGLYPLDDCSTLPTAALVTVSDLQTWSDVPWETESPSIQNIYPRCPHYHIWGNSYHFCFAGHLFYGSFVLRRPHFLLYYLISSTSLMAQTVKLLPAMRETWVWSLGQEDPLEKEMATHSSTRAWKIPWTEEPGGLQSMGLQRLGHFTFIFLSW